MAIGNGWENEMSHSTKFFDECQRTVHSERTRGFPALTKPGVAARSASIRGSADLTWCPGLGCCQRLPAWRRHILSTTQRTLAPSAAVAGFHHFRMLALVLPSVEKLRGGGHD